MIMIIPLNRLSVTLCSLFIQAAGLYFTWHSPSKTEWLSSDHFGMPLWPHELSVDAEEGAVLLAAESTNIFIRWIARCSLGPLLHNSVCPAVHLYILRGAGWVGKDCNALNLQRWATQRNRRARFRNWDKGRKRERNWFVGEWRLLSSTLHNSADLFHLRNKSSQRSWQILVRLKYSPSMSSSKCSFPSVS